MHGKLINGKLVCSNDWYIQGENFISDDEEQLLQYGYKPIVFSKPDLKDNCLGYVAKFEEMEGQIIQKWDEIEPSFDLSQDYYAVSKDTASKFEFLINDITRVKKEDVSGFNKIIKQYPWMSKLYSGWKKLDSGKRVVDSDIPKFLDKFGVLDDVLKLGFHIDGSCLIDNDVQEDYRNLPVREIKGKIISLPFVKSHLHMLECFENNKTFSTAIEFKMIYQYGVLIFDEFLIDSIKIILKSNKKRMISDENITIKDIIECDDYESVIDKIIYNLLEDKEFESLSDKITYLEKFGVTIKYPKDTDINDVSFINEKRNCIVHNHSEISRISYSRLKKEKNKHIKDISVGMNLDISSFIIDDLVILYKLVKNISTEICRKEKMQYRFLND